MEDQDKKCALVTGSSNGIGEAIVKKLAQLDYKLIVTGRNETDIKRVAEDCAKLSPSKMEPLQIKADLGLEEDVERLFKETMSHFNNKLNLLINNAGFAKAVSHKKPDECYENYKQVMQTNFNATVRLTLLCSQVMKETGNGVIGSTCIVNIGSINSFRPAQSLFAYGVSKAALNSFTEAMAIELAPYIRVNCVSPGPVETKIIERGGFPLELFKKATSEMSVLKRIGQPDEIAEAVLFLADPNKASFITGSNLVIDGGCLLSPLRWDQK